MKHLKRVWRKFPVRLRKLIVGIFGTIFIIAAALTGWLPGPGGIPLLLVGIAILATEFEWAEVVRDKIFDILHDIDRWLKRHKHGGISIVIILFSLLILIFMVNLEKF